MFKRDPKHSLAEGKGHRVSRGDVSIEHMQRCETDVSSGSRVLPFVFEMDEEGKYKTTRTGEAQFLMMSVAMRRMLEILDQL